MADEQGGGQQPPRDRKKPQRPKPGPRSGPPHGQGGTAADGTAPRVRGRGQVDRAARDAMDRRGRQAAPTVRGRHGMDHPVAGRRPAPDRTADLVHPVRGRTTRDPDRSTGVLARMIAISARTTGVRDPTIAIGAHGTGIRDPTTVASGPTTAVSDQTIVARDRTTGVRVRTTGVHARMSVGRAHTTASDARMTVRPDRQTDDRPVVTDHMDDRPARPHTDPVDQAPGPDPATGIAPIRRVTDGMPRRPSGRRSRRPRRSARTRSSSPVDAQSRRPSSLVAPRIGCSSCRSDAGRSKSWSCTRRTCASRSSRSKADR